MHEQGVHKLPSQPVLGGLVVSEQTLAVPSTQAPVDGSQEQGVHKLPSQPVLGGVVVSEQTLAVPSSQAPED